MRIENTKVYGIDETARASGYPMLADMERESGAVYEHMARLHRLGRAKSGSGHLEEWRIFCNWATGELPLFARLIGEDKP